MIVLEVEGIQYGGFTSAQAQLRLDALSNTFSFDATSDRANPLPFRGGEACSVFVDGELVLTGNIEIVSAAYESNKHTISFQGRDKTGDLLDSSLGGKGSDDATPLADITRGNFSLQTLCRRVIAHIGADIVVVDEVNPKLFKEAEDNAAPEPGQGAFEFLEKYSRKRQVLLSSDAQGNLLLTASRGETIDASIIHRIDDPGGANNVIRADVSYDSTGRFNLYRAISQLNTTPGSLAGTLAAASVASQGGQKAIDDQIRKGRQLILVSEAAVSGTDSKDRATWEANIRKARGRVYSAELSGFRDQEGNLWRLNTLPQVIDQFAGIEARMLVNIVTFSTAISDGTEKVTLGFVEKNAYTLELEEPIEEKVGTGTGGLLPGVEG